MIEFLLILVPCVIVGVSVSVLALRMGWAPSSHDYLPKRQAAWEGMNILGMVALGLMVVWVVAWIVALFVGLNLILSAA